MKKILIWGNGINDKQYLKKIKHLEKIKDIEVIGFASNEISHKKYGYNFCEISSITKMKFDSLLITSESSFKEIYDEAIGLGVPESKIMKANILNIPDFSMEKYITLKNSNISILTNNCWGGLTYHYLNLRFLSPFINMYESDADYLKALQNLRQYLDYPLKLYKSEYEPNLKFNFPVYWLNDIRLYMNHYSNFDEAINKWEERKKRINWDNLFVMMYTSDEEILKEFDKLPYEKKVCFVPFKSNLPSAFFIDYHKSRKLRNRPFYEIVNMMAAGGYQYYDIFELLAGNKKCLINGRKHPLSIFRS